MEQVVDREVATRFGDMEVTGDLEKNRKGGTVRMEIGGEKGRTTVHSQSFLGTSQEWPGSRAPEDR